MCVWLNMTSFSFSLSGSASVFFGEPLSHLHSLPGVPARSENLVFVEALLWIKQLSVRFQRAASSLVITIPKSRCKGFHSLLFIREVFHSLLHTGFGMVNRLKDFSHIVCPTLYLSPSLPISLLFQVSKRRGRGMWSHESCGVCNSCEGGIHINSAYMHIGSSGLNSNCFFTQLHSYLVSPAGMGDSRLWVGIEEEWLGTEGCPKAECSDCSGQALASDWGTSHLFE